MQPHQKTLFARDKKTVDANFSISLTSSRTFGSQPFDGTSQHNKLTRNPAMVALLPGSEAANKLGPRED